jgi:hypothetical protein
VKSGTRSPGGAAKGGVVTGDSDAAACSPVAGSCSDTA